MAERHDGKFSSFVSKTLNNIGYSWQAICRRRNFGKKLERICLSFTVREGFTAILAGSLREGVGKWVGSDIDIMLVFNEVICREDFGDFESMRHLTVFEIDFQQCPPGYAHLTLLKHGGRLGMDTYTNASAGLVLQTIIEDSCCGSESGILYFNNDMFMKIWPEICPVSDDPFVIMVQTPRAGPSSPYKSRTDFGQVLNADIDCVPSFPCHCPSLFEKFRNRPRRHGWPSPDLLQELSQLDAHAVAVGDKLSEDHYLQWRICFTQAEIRLIESLTEPQIHVFVLLKIFAKEVLKKIWDKMTSYVVKNLILWMAELTPTHKFQTDTIVERFLDCLFFLKICVKTGFLPNYMISERNLLRNEHFIVKRKQLLPVLEGCLYEKGSCLLKSETLREALLEMYSRPEVALQHGIDRETFFCMLWSVLEGMLSEIPSVKHDPPPLQDVFISVLTRTIRYCDASVGSELVQLGQRIVSVEETQRDPATALQKMLHGFTSLMK